MKKTAPLVVARDDEERKPEVTPRHCPAAVNSSRRLVQRRQLERVLRLMARSWANSWRVYEYLEIPDCVDNLQHFAKRTGLVKMIGQDAVQAIIDEELRPVRDRVAAGESKRGDILEEDQAQQDGHKTAQSTVDAFFYLVRLGDSARLKCWLDDHPLDREHLQRLLREKQCRS
jgi:hypothetical protein